MLGVSNELRKSVEIFLPQSFEKIILVEWKAQELQHAFKKSGPMIELLVGIPPKGIQNEEEISLLSNYLVMQGSFDPPTLPHLDLLLKAIKLRLSRNPLEPIKVVVLLSLAHVDKKFNVLDRSLLGYRVEMLEVLFNYLKLPYSITIGLSNVARYIDLIKAIQHLFNDIKTISFIMGMDVFNKVLDPNYYIEPLEEVLPKIFKADYLVAGRNAVFSEDDYLSYVNDKLPDYLQDKVQFLSLPNHFRLISASQIRESLSKNQTYEEVSIHPTVLEYLKGQNLYRVTPDWQATKIAIQIIIQLTLEAGKSQIAAMEILNHLLPKIKNNEELQQILIREYQNEGNKEITKRWNQISKLVS